jgi:predicted phage terminase large subunit-like protein
MSNRTDRIEQYNKIHAMAKKNGVLIEAMRELCKTDLFYLLTRACGRNDVNNDWLFDRCAEVQADPDGRLDLWSREHYKSTIITFAKTIQDILVNPEVTVGIFSHTKPIARAFLRQIKFELEGNERIKYLFPDVLYANPRIESKNWSEDNGITVKRLTNPKEATVEASGLVDGQPTSKHYMLLVYDDVVTRESVTSPEMIKKTTEAWELSLNLGAQGGRRRIIGTRYHYNDSYATMIERGSAIPRIYPATDTGKVDGIPVFLTQEVLDEKRRDMGVYIFGCQMLQDPKADQAQGFKAEWLRYWDVDTTDRMNIYIFVDPANSKKQSADYTTIFVIGLGFDKNYYVIDIVRDRLNLVERTKKVFEFHGIYRPINVIYEQYGMQSDIQHIEDKQKSLNYRFNIIPVGGSTPKPDRIKRLVSVFEAGRVYIPAVLHRSTQEGKTENMTNTFIKEEYLAFPVMSHDDMLDCLARVVDPQLNLMFPRGPNLKVISKTKAQEDWARITGQKTSRAKVIDDNFTNSAGV